ncbi:AfsR/SARP family transcriptional regulator [Actinoplanes subtropicus]|uniref:AfsR/SARP family transcriptional regulator n=1 Tax=Actinoplanes subtropicus TaxID=543632 RepID=UPI000AD047AF|nr:tetratricopeptide repeat protein [Actinoplanes subtropicus]
MLEFKMLGPLEVWRGDVRVSLPGLRVERALLALLFDVDRTVSLGRLIDAIWDEAPPATARRQVQDVVARLRRLLSGPGGPPAVITTEPDGYRLHLAPHRLDAVLFAELVSGAGERAQDGAAALRSALSLWRAPLLSGTCGAALEPAARSWDERRLSAIQDCVSREAETGHTAEAISELQSLVAAFPLQEQLVVLLIRIMAGAGRRAEAIEAYLALRRRLAEDLGLDPGPEARQAYETLLHDSDGPRTTPASRKPARFTLPAGTMAFTGRRGELDAIAAAAQDSAVVAIHAIDGMPGVGKTTLAVQAAHQLAGRFPDRQIFIDLHAHAAGRLPADPADALADLLTADGVDPRQLPDKVDGRAALWRDRLAGTRTVVVLDNVASTAQITPLLPGSPGCLVLVTSRRRLADLAATHLFLDILPAADAIAMFERLAPRAAGQADAVAEIVEVCGYLPLAIAITAGLFGRHTSWTPAQLITEVRKRRLIATGEYDTVQAAFDLSYHHLPEPRQRFFRLLGLHPGVDIDGYAAAALTGVPYQQALDELDALSNDHLIEEPVYRRYGMHVLIREYTHARATALDPADVRERAVRRLLDYYRHTSSQADMYLTRHSRPAGSAAPVPPDSPDLSSWGEAAAWLRTERPNLLAAIRHAAGRRWDRYTVGLTAGVAALLYTDGPWTLAADLHRAAAAAAERCDDRRGQAGALYELAAMRWLSGDYAAAADLLEQALGLYRAAGDLLGQANTLDEWGGVRYLTADYPGATDFLRQSLELYEAVGDLRGEAYARHDLGAVQHQSGDYAGADAQLARALTLHRAAGNPHGEALTLSELGVVRYLTGDYPGATDLSERALNLYRTLGNPRGQAISMYFLGTVRRLSGDCDGAVEWLEQALKLHRAIGNRHGVGMALTQLGASYCGAGDYRRAEELLRQGQLILREVGAPDDEAEALNHLGTLQRLTAHPGLARASHQEALAIANRIGLHLEEAHGLEGIGRAALDLGDTADALAHLRQALDIYTRLGVTDGNALTAELAVLTPKDARLRNGLQAGA